MSAARTDDTTETGRISVLVVEDSPDHRMLMQRKLRDAGMTVSTAATGEEALELVRKVDLVLLDYRLPKMSGMETLRAIREGEQAPSVVMITGMGSTDLAVEAMRAGAIDYLTKNPGYLQALPSVVERAWRQHDVARRAGELQRLALLVNSAQDRSEVVHEIVKGARRLLRAQSCALLVDRERRLSPAEVHGDDPGILDTVRKMPRDSLPTPGEAMPIEAGNLLVALPSEDGEPYGLLALFGRDRTDFLEEELELGKAFASFAGIALRNVRRRELEEALIAELQQTIEARRDFVASVSHELRTPLTSIGGYTETVIERWDLLQDEQKLDFMAKIQSHAVELERLVEQLIDVAGLERGKGFQAQIEQVQLQVAVGAALRSLELVIRDREVVADVPAIAVEIDETLFRRTLTNLVSNALKFSALDDPVRIEGQAEAGMVRIKVIDHGVGLEPREAARVFDPFWRASHSVANAVRGSGIGLSLVREYVRTMGGEVSVDSSPGNGSTFSFTVPIAGPGDDQALNDG